MYYYISLSCGLCLSNIQYKICPPFCLNEAKFCAWKCKIQNKNKIKQYQCCWLSVNNIATKMKLRNSWQVNTRWLILNIKILLLFVCAIAVQCICGGIWGVSNDALQVCLHQHHILAHLPCQHSCGDRCHCHNHVLPWILGWHERESMHAHQCKSETMLIIEALLIFILDYV